MLMASHVSTAVPELAIHMAAPNPNPNLFAIFQSVDQIQQTAYSKWPVNKR